MGVEPQPAIPAHQLFRVVDPAYRKLSQTQRPPGPSKGDRATARVARALQLLDELEPARRSRRP